jgi:Bacterial protein of unknown function (DUF839)
VLGSGGRTADVLMNHELPGNRGAVRAYGQTGAFVARLTVDQRTGAILAGRDLITDVHYWRYLDGAYGDAPQAPDITKPHSPAFSRFCSGALTEPGQLLNRRTGNGYAGQLYFANEENRDEGRTFAVETDGTAWQLPHLGLFSWENTVAAANRTDTTLVMGNEDVAAGQLRAYHGTKQRTGSAVDRAGLTNGVLTVVDTVNPTVTDDAQFRATYGTGTPAPVRLDEIDWHQSGSAQNTQAAAAGLTLNRIEDGAFDPRRPNDYYFTTTEGGDTTPDPKVGATRDGGGLWRLSFQDIERPELGGTLTLLLDGSEAPYLNKPDNITIDERGNLLIQEDPGGNDSLARIVAYPISDGARAVLAQFDPALFGVTDPTATAPADRAELTTDEESSGIIDVSGTRSQSGAFLFDAQVHLPHPDPELVEHGQLLTMTVANWNRVYGDDRGGHGRGNG